jgi:uncharacterized tellurite resistance protein B-like protein
MRAGTQAFDLGFGPGIVGRESMHIVIAVVTAVAGLFWALTALRNSGFQFSSLNPFLAIRRWRWSRDYGAKPLYKLERPMDAAGVLLVAIAKADGIMSAEQKRELLSLFERHFDVSASEASQLFAASIHLLRDELTVAEQVPHILERSASRFEPNQTAELLTMMRKIAVMDGSVNAEQQQLLDAVEHYFASLHAPQQKWR